MRRNLIRILSLLFFSFLLAVPASAATLPQCAPAGGTSEFVLVAQDNIIFEPQQLQAPPRIIQGNVLVTSPHPAGGTFNNTGKGFVKVGSNTNVQGAVIADVIFLPDAGATIANCIANQIMGSPLALSKGSCQNLPTPTPTAPAAPFTFNTYATAHPSCVEPPLGTLLATPSTAPGSFSNLCGPSPVIDACADTAADLTLARGETLTLTRRGLFRLSAAQHGCRAQPHRVRGVYLQSRSHGRRLQAERASNRERERQVLH